MRTLGIRARWAVPAGAVAVTGIVIAAATVASADAAPSLPARTPRQLLTEVAGAGAKPLGPLTATVQESGNLGLPALQLPGQQGGADGPSSGPRSVSIWYRDPQHVRIAERVPANETDLRLDGRTLWVWNSKTQTATRYALPAAAPNAKPGAAGKSVASTPAAAAAQALKAIGPTTVVSVQRNVYVAGRAAYQLSLVPRSSKSLVGSVLIAIDASRHIPLRVEVFPRGSSTVAYSVGFTALSFGTPAASNFSFTPPPGATVRKVTVPGNLKSLLGQAGLGQAGLGSFLSGFRLGGLLAGTAIGSTVAAGSAVAAGSSAATARLSPPVRVAKTRNGKLVIVNARTGKLVTGKAVIPKLVKPITAVPGRVLKKIEAQFARSLPASMTKAQRAAAIKAFGKHFADAQSVVLSSGMPSGWTGYAPLASGTHVSAPHVIGTGWLSVIATPPNPAVAAAVKQELSGGQLPATSGPAPSVTPSAGAYAAALQALLKATVKVQGTWGSGRLLQTSLLSVLVTSKGQILAGAVTPHVLYADVAADAG